MDDKEASEAVSEMQSYAFGEKFIGKVTLEIEMPGLPLKTNQTAFGKKIQPGVA